MYFIEDFLIYFFVKNIFKLWWFFKKLILILILLLIIVVWEIKYKRYNFFFSWKIKGDMLVFFKVLFFLNWLLIKVIFMVEKKIVFYILVNIF